MGTREPVLVDSSGNFPFLPALLLVFSGIIGITFWLAWMFFKSKNRGRDERIYVSSASIPAATAPSNSYLLGMRRSEAGEWEIYVNDVRYRALEAVPGDAVRREVVVGMKELVTFARSYLQKEPAAASAPAAPPAGPVPAARLEAPAPPPSLKTPPPVVKPTPPPDAAGGRPRPRLSDEPELKRTTAPAQFLTLDLAKDIGDIVEEMQQRTPALRDRTVRLRNAASGGVEFALDGLVYATLEEIPDAAVQELIRTAIKEWERR